MENLEAFYLNEDARLEREMNRWFPWKEEPEWNYHHFAHRTKKAKAHAKPKRKTKGGRKHA